MALVFCCIAALSWYHTIQYSTVNYSAVQCSTVQYTTAQHTAVQHSTVLVIAIALTCRVMTSTDEMSSVLPSTVWDHKLPAFHVMLNVLALISISAATAMLLRADLASLHAIGSKKPTRSTNTRTSSTSLEQTVQGT